MTSLARRALAQSPAWVGMLLALAAIACGAQTDDDTARLRVSGFGTLGLVQVDAPAGWGFRRDITQPGHLIGGARGQRKRLEVPGQDAGFVSRHLCPACAPVRAGAAVGDGARPAVR